MKISPSIPALLGIACIACILAVLAVDALPPPKSMLASTVYSTYCIDAYAYAGTQPPVVGRCNLINPFVDTDPKQQAFQRWTLTSTGQLINDRTHKCLTYDKAPSNTTVLTLKTCCAAMTAQQSWEYKSDGSLVPCAAHHMCLTMYVSNPRLGFARCSSAIAGTQKWSFAGVNAPPGIGVFSAEGSGGYLLSIDGGNAVQGPLLSVQLSSDYNNNYQMWTLTSKGQLVNRATGRCMTHAAKPKVNTTITQAECTLPAQQAWTYDMAHGYLRPVHYPSLYVSTFPIYTDNDVYSLVLDALDPTNNRGWWMYHGVSSQRLMNLVPGDNQTLCVESGVSKDVTMGRCSGADVQKWFWNGVGQIMNIATRRCMTYSIEVAVVFQDECSRLTHQVWWSDTRGWPTMLTPVVDHELCLTLPSESDANGTYRPELQACNSTEPNGQVWVYPWTKGPIPGTL